MKTHRLFSAALVSITALLSSSVTSVAFAQAKPAKKAAVSKAKSPAKKASPAARAENDEANWTKNVGGLFRTLKVIDSETLAAVSETSAAVIDGRYLVVPWSFVSQVWLGQAQTKFILGETRQDVQLIDIDVLSNLALFRIDVPTSPFISRQMLRVDMPQAGEPMVVIHSKNAVRGTARFARAQSDNYIQRYLFESNVAERGQTGYYFDRNGRLVALASSAGVEDGAASARSLMELIRKQEGPKPASVDAADARRRQVYYWQDRQSQMVSPTRNVLTLRGLDCKVNLATIPDKSVAGEIHSIRSQHCKTPLTVELGGGYRTGLEVWKNEISLLAVQTDDAERIARELSKTAFADLEKSASIVNLLTPTDCQENAVTNNQGKRVRVRFCTSALKVESGLSDTVFYVSTVESNGRAYVTIARLKGIAKDNTKRILEAAIETIRSQR